MYKRNENKPVRGNSLKGVKNMGFPGGSVGKESAWCAEDLSSMHGWGRSPGEGNGRPLQYPRTEEPGRLHGVHGVPKHWA